MAKLRTDDAIILRYCSVGSVKSIAILGYLRVNRREGLNKYVFRELNYN